jgi:hypothetical protein
MPLRCESRARTFRLRGAAYRRPGLPSGARFMRCVISVVAPLRALIDEIRLVPENGRIEIELAGDLAGILALTADSKKPATISRDGLPVTLVAGTRNCLDLLLTARVP